MNNIEAIYKRGIESLDLNYANAPDVLPERRQRNARRIARQDDLNAPGYERRRYSTNGDYRKRRLGEGRHHRRTNGAADPMITTGRSAQPVGRGA